MQNAEDYARKILAMGEPIDDRSYFLGELLLASAIVCRNLSKDLPPDKVKAVAESHKKYFCGIIDILFLPMQEGLACDTRKTKTRSKAH